MQAVTASGAQYLEAPVSGSKQPAEQGQLIFLCGGSRELFDKSIPLLEVMGKAQFFLGKVGNGANMVRCLTSVNQTLGAQGSTATALLKTPCTCSLQAGVGAGYGCSPADALCMQHASKCGLYRLQDAAQLGSRRRRGSSRAYALPALSTGAGIFAVAYEPPKGIKGTQAGMTLCLKFG